jgi:DNA ligase N terminus
VGRSFKHQFNVNLLFVVTMSDIEEEEDDDRSHIESALLSRADLLDAEYPNRPKNASPSLQFRNLVCSLLEAMVDLQQKPRTQKGPQYSAHEARRDVINRFIQRWRNEVGPDIYPAFRLIMPGRDKDRPMYGLKEASLGKMLVVVWPGFDALSHFVDYGYREGF